MSKIYNLFTCLVILYCVDGAIDHSDETLNRSKRFLPFLPGSGTGVSFYLCLLSIKCVA